MIAGIAQFGSVHQPGPEIPIASRKLFTTPLLGFSNHLQTMLTAIQLVTTGKKNDALKKVLPGTFELRAREKAARRRKQAEDTQERRQMSWKTREMFLGKSATPDNWTVQ